MRRNPKNPASQSGLFNPRILVVLALFSVGGLLAMVSLAAPVSALRLPNPPPLTAPVVKQPAIGPVCPATVDKEKELMIRDLAVVEDSTRTTGTGVWTFGHLMQRLAGSFDPAIVSSFTMDWLNTWMVDQSVDQVPGGQPFPETVKARPGIKSVIIDPWRSASGCAPTGTCTLDMTKAPFRLLAIVNRVDLRQIGTDCSVYGCAFGQTAANSGEGRFVFGALQNGSPLQFTVIFEFKLPGFDGFDAQQWARRWHELGTAPQIPDPPQPPAIDQSCWVDPCFTAGAIWKEKMMWSMGYCVDPALAALFSANFPKPPVQVCMPQPTIPQPACNAVSACPAWSRIALPPPGPITYNQKLQAITESFAFDSQLGQLRTNEIALDGPWQLREFHLGVDPSTKRNVLQITTVKQTPASSLNNTQLLADFINQNEADILAQKHTVPITFEGAQFRGGSSDQSIDHWFAKNGSGQSLIRNNDARHVFSKNSCNGCHLRETETPFLQVFPRANGLKSALSAFLCPSQDSLGNCSNNNGDFVVSDPESGTPRTFNDLERRRKDMEQLICEANPSTIQTVNTSVH